MSKAEARSNLQRSRRLLKSASASLKKGDVDLAVQRLVEAARDWGGGEARYEEAYGTTHATALPKNIERELNTIEDRIANLSAEIGEQFHT